MFDLPSGGFPEAQTRSKDVRQQQRQRRGIYQSLTIGGGQPVASEDNGQGMTLTNKRGVPSREYRIPGMGYFVVQDPEPIRR